METVVTVGFYLLIIVVGVSLSLAVFRTPRYSESEYQISRIRQYMLKSGSFGRGRMNMTAFFLGHIIELGAGFVIAVILGNVFRFDLAVMLWIIGALICFVWYSCYVVAVCRFASKYKVGWMDLFPRFRATPMVSFVCGMRTDTMHYEYPRNNDHY